MNPGRILLPTGNDPGDSGRRSRVAGKHQVLGACPVFP